MEVDRHPIVFRADLEEGIVEFALTDLFIKGGELEPDATDKVEMGNLERNKAHNVAHDVAAKPCRRGDDEGVVDADLDLR